MRLFFVFPLNLFGQKSGCLEVAAQARATVDVFVKMLSENWLIKKSVTFHFGYPFEFKLHALFGGCQISGTVLCG